jgi:hypothetical protein
MDMMRPQAAAAPPKAPTGLSGVAAAGPSVVLTWTDQSKNETGFTIQRRVQATPANPWTTVGTVGAGVTTFTDTSVTSGTTYNYQVFAVNKVGYAGPAAQVGAYPTIELSSSAISTTVLATFIAPPSAVVAQCNTATGGRWNCAVRWTDNTSNETRFVVQRATNSNFTQANTNFVGARAGVGGTVNFTVTGLPSIPAPGGYYFRVRAEVGSMSSAWVNASPFPERP